MGVNFTEFDVRQAARPCKVFNGSLSVECGCAWEECPWISVCDLPQRSKQLNPPTGPPKLERVVGSPNFMAFITRKK